MARQRRAFGGIRKLPSARYQASYVGPDGLRHVGWSTYLVKADAEHWLREEELLTDRAGWTPPARRPPVDEASPMTLAEYADANLRRRASRNRKPLRPSTVELYDKLLRLAILPTLGAHRLVDITPDMIARWHDALPAATPTQNGNAYLLLRSLFIDAEHEDLIGRNPCRLKGAGKPEPQHKGVALNVGELGVYAHAADRHALALFLAVWCSLRSGEVRALRRRDVAADGSAITVEQTVTRLGKAPARYWHFGPAKTGAGQRTVAVPDHLQGALRAWIDAHPGNPDGLLFPAADGTTPLGADALSRAHKIAAAAAGHPEMHVHDLRRTGATLAGHAGATIRELMRRLGHTTPGVAMIYQVADDQRDRDLAARMSRQIEAPKGKGKRKGKR